MPAFWGAVIAGVGSLAGGAIASRGAERAGREATRASNQQIDYSRETRDIVLGLQQPYREAGYTGLGALMNLTGLPAPSTPARGGAVGGGNQWGGPGFDPDQPMTRTQVMQAFRYLYGRDADEQAIRHYTTRGPRSGVGRQGSIAHSYNPLRSNRWSPDSVLGLNDPPDRRAWTFNEFLAEGLAAQEYQDRREDGTLPPWIEGGQYSQNFTGSGIRDEQARAATLQQFGGGGDESTGGGAVGGGGGGGALGQTPEEMLRSNPAYEFRLNEGMRALETSAAARGGFGTGFDRRAIRYGQDYASNEYERLWNRLAAISGIGQTATAASGNAVSQSGSQVIGAIGDMGATRASAYASQANAWGNAIQQGAQLYGYYRGQQASPPPTDYGDPRRWIGG